jgi:4a-hydroxytetrahydrobiopterin dehydratase
MDGKMKQKMLDWEEVDYWPDGKNQKALKKNFTFPDFRSALDFVNGVGELAEKVQHHPDINFGWGYVQIWLTSHDVHGITEKDKSLAVAIDTSVK